MIGVQPVDRRNTVCRFRGWIYVSTGALRSGDCARVFVTGMLNLEAGEAVGEGRLCRGFVWDAQSRLLGPLPVEKFLDRQR